MNRNINFKTLEEKRKELANLKAEWEVMKEQEKKLKEKFYSSPFEKRAKIKRELTSLQEEIFEKRNGGTNVRIEIEREESLKNRVNPVGSPTNPKKLANLLKKDLQDILTNDSRWKKESYNFDYMEIAKGEEIWVMHHRDNKEIEKALDNLPRHRGSKEEYANDIKPSDFDQQDYNEILRMVRQISELGEVKRKQRVQQSENKLKNNPSLFSSYRCSTDPEYNGIGHWQNWTNFSGFHNGREYNIMVPDNHLALTNVLFNDGWGTNSEIKNLYLVKGIVAPTQLYYWNQDQQKDEIISETEAKRTGKKVYYKKIVNLNDKITIDHYQENSQQELAKPVSGVNDLVENTNQKNMNGGLVMKGVENPNSPKMDTEFLLQYFQDHDIKQMSLTPEGELLIEYNDGRTEISEKVNNQELQKVISYYQKNGQTNLSQQDLINAANATNSPTTTPKNNQVLLAILGVGGVLLIGITIGLWLRKDKVKKTK